jgi:hypothetical protein
MLMRNVRNWRRLGEKPKNHLWCHTLRRWFRIIASEFAMRFAWVHKASWSNSWVKMELDRYQKNREPHAGQQPRDAYGRCGLVFCNWMKTTKNWPIRDLIYLVDDPEFFITEVGNSGASKMLVILKKKKWMEGRFICESVESRTYSYALISY